MRHAPPRMILGRRLREPHIPSITSQLARLQSPCNRITVADLAAGRVDNVRAALHSGEEVIVEQVLRLRVQRAIDSDNVAMRHHVLGGLMPREIQLLLDTLRQSM